MKEVPAHSYLTARQWGAGRLALAAISDPEWQGELLLCEALGITRAEFLMNPQKEITPAQGEHYAVLIRALAEGMPLQYLCGRTEFYGRKFIVTPAVLIPRADTETLVEVALTKIDALSPHRAGGVFVLDLCTGSGCVGLTLAAERPFGRYTLTDISSSALGVAEENAKLLGLNSRAEFLAGDLFAPVHGRRFDLIVSNPPYIPTAEIRQLDRFVQREPHLALDGGSDGLDFYRAIIASAARYLTPRGCLALEIGSTQGESVAAIFVAHGFRGVTLTRDLAGRDRVCAGEKCKRQMLPTSPLAVPHEML
ncbi:MAG: Release factor glutamine methyltransferase [Firmicutes bacterium]|nr:Release factor glutamine methyltransferase [Bacillota bacterium]